MLIAHLADLHLGYRAYHRLTAGGINARERDVALAFRAALDRVVELEADLVLIAGDVFHTVRPSNAAIADAFRQFSRLRTRLPEAPVVVIAGNHDSPRAVETGSILRLFAEISGVIVVDAEPRTVHLEELDTSVLCVPHNGLVRGERIAFEPDESATTNILMLHGDVVGGPAEGKLRYVSEYGGASVETSEIRPERWDYVALGHYHIATEITPNMGYAGGIERTSTNIWEEAAAPKGFLTFDTETKKATFHPLPGREVVDLPRLSAARGDAETRRSGGGGDEARGDAETRRSGGGGDEARGDAETRRSGGGEDEACGDAEARRSGGGEDEVRGDAEVRGREVAERRGEASPRPRSYLSASEIDERIRALVERVPGGIEGKIVRLVITDIPRELFRELDHRQIREYKAEALHFHLDARRPEVHRTVGSGAPVRRLTLSEEVESFLKRHWQPTSPEIDRERLVALADRYLAEAAGGEPEDVLVESRDEGEEVGQ